jgi:hypothetical protein
VFGGQVAKGQFVLPMLGIHSLQPFPGRFLFGQQLLGEQSEPRTLGGQGAFGRLQPIPAMK